MARRIPRKNRVPQVSRLSRPGWGQCATPAKPGSGKRQTRGTRRNDDLRPEYDLAQLTGGVRGKYRRQAVAGTNLILIEPELARVFRDSESVNRALRLLLETASASAAPARQRHRVPKKRLQPAR